MTLSDEGIFVASVAVLFWNEHADTDHLTLGLGLQWTMQVDWIIEALYCARTKPHWDQLGEDVLSVATQPD